MVRRDRFPSRSPDRARARSSGARSSGLQRLHRPDAGLQRPRHGRPMGLSLPRGESACGDTRLKMISREMNVQMAEFSASLVTRKLDWPPIYNDAVLAGPGLGWTSDPSLALSSQCYTR
eukprot:7920169-Pyramimonas_sp.AAC.1